MPCVRIAIAAATDSSNRCNKTIRIENLNYWCANSCETAVIYAWIKNFLSIVWRSASFIRWRLKLGATTCWSPSFSSFVWTLWTLVLVLIHCRQFCGSDMAHLAVVPHSLSLVIANAVGMCRLVVDSNQHRQSKQQKMQQKCQLPAK